MVGYETGTESECDDDDNDPDSEDEIWGDCRFEEAIDVLKAWQIPGPKESSDDPDSEDRFDPAD